MDFDLFNEFEQKEESFLPIQNVIDNVKKMAYDPKARQIANSQSLVINTVNYEDCARNKFSVWGPCISDMTLQVNGDRMPVIREPNYLDKTWDVETNKIPLVVGNHDTNPGAALKTISLHEYLVNFTQFMSTPPKYGKKINLVANDMFARQNDKYVIMSTQCCFLPIEKGKETKFNIVLFNYASKAHDPAVLVIVSTAKGTSAQIIEGNEQKLLCNNYGRKADFTAQRLSDNRIERKVSVQGPMTKEEKQDNCIVVIQVPLKQKPKQIHTYSTQYEYNYVAQPHFNNSQQTQQVHKMSKQWQQSVKMWGVPPCDLFDFGAAHKVSSMNNAPPKMTHVEKRRFKKKNKNFEEANVEAAIVRIAPKTNPICSCGELLQQVQLRKCYNGECRVNCDQCRKLITDSSATLWHCTLEKLSLKHKNGYDLCMECGDEQLKYDELNGMQHIERDTRYPIRVTLQYYKSTDNGVISAKIMKEVKDLLQKSQSQADYIGSLVTDYSVRATEPDLITKNETKVIHHVNKVKVPQPVEDPFDALFDDMGKIIDHGKYDKIANALKITSEKDWKIYLENFKREEVTDNDLGNLCREDLVQLIPKMGPRNRFLKWLQSESRPETNFMSGFL